MNLGIVKMSITKDELKIEFETIMFCIKQLKKEYEMEINEIEDNLKHKVIDESIDAQIRYTEQLTLQRVVKDLEELLK